MVFDPPRAQATKGLQRLGNGLDHLTLMPENMEVAVREAPPPRGD